MVIFFSGNSRFASSAELPTVGAGYFQVTEEALRAFLLGKGGIFPNRKGFGDKFGSFASSAEFLKTTNSSLKRNLPRLLLVVFRGSAEEVVFIGRPE